MDYSPPGCSGIFPTQTSKPGLPHLQADSLPAEPQGKPWFCFLWLQTCGIFAPQPGIGPTPLMLEGEVLIPRLPGEENTINVSGSREKK